jgi:hypothetical protein
MSVLLECTHVTSQVLMQQSIWLTNYQILGNLQCSQSSWMNIHSFMVSRSSEFDRTAGYEIHIVIKGNCHCPSLSALQIMHMSTAIECPIFQTCKSALWHKLQCPSSNKFNPVHLFENEVIIYMAKFRVPKPQKFVVFL